VVTNESPVDQVRAVEGTFHRLAFGERREQQVNTGEMGRQNGGRAVPSESFASTKSVYFRSTSDCPSLMTSIPVRPPDTEVKFTVSL
jgi:hypothetical protein